MKPALAFLLVILAVVNPLLADAATPTLAKECVALSNALNLVPPTSPAAAAKSTHAARAAITRNLAKWVNNPANQSKLAEAQSQLLSNRAAIVASDPDVKPLYNSLRAAGSNLTLAQVKKMAASTSAQREQILDAVESQGLANVLLYLPKGDPFTSSGPQPADDYCYLLSLGNDLLALAALVAFSGQEEIALAMAAVGAAMYFYGEYVGCTVGSTGDDGGDFFITDND